MVVNNSIKEDFVNKINDTIKIKDLETEPNKFEKVLSYLAENYNSEKDNLLIIDINNSPKDAIEEFVDDFINQDKLPEGWKCLLVSRECQYSDATYCINLNDNEQNNIVLLKQIFLNKAGEKYKDFADFDKLFKTIHYSPLLAEQLGIYLQNPAVKTYQEIYDILHKQVFKETERKGVTAKNRYETEEKSIIGFLRNLINIEDFSDAERSLLQHFIIWPTDYINKGVISGLLKNIISPEELDKALSNLVQKSNILSEQNGDNTTQYKLHGLIAESLREQIDIKNADYIRYIFNCLKITELDYWNFIPYSECIGYSFSEYEITDNDYNLFSIALKLQKSFVANYAQSIYNKVIKLTTDKVKNNPNNPEYQNDLAVVYNNLAILESEHLNEYTDAQTHYLKAIEIRKKLPTNNPEYQNDLASTYNGLANLESDHLNDYKGAQTHYLKAIEIRKKLPTNNPEYQNDLASTYNNLATLEFVHLNDYKGAQTHYLKAIEIREKLPTNNPVYQNDLARAYNNLASLEKNHLNDYKGAQTHYLKAIEIQEKLPTNNPVYQNDLAMLYNNLANLESDHLNDYKGAQTHYLKAIEIQEKLPTNNPEYQNLLARTYNNLATLEFVHLNDYKGAQTHYLKAIEIQEKLPTNNPVYQNDLADAYNGLAYFYEKIDKYSDAIESVNKAIEITYKLKDINSKYLIYWLCYRHSLSEIKFNHGDKEGAKEILLEIKPLAEKCLQEHPNDNWTKQVNKGIDELLKFL